MQISLSQCAPSSLIAYAPFLLRFFWHDEKLQCVDIEPGGSTVYVEGSQKEQALTLDWLSQYFRGSHQPLSVVSPTTAFSCKVHDAMSKIPFASTISYEELARRAGNAKAFRAAGQACAKNPVPLVIPCHRVVAKDATLCGFNKGVNIKKLLIELESRINKGMCL